MKNLALDFETSEIPRHYPWIDGSYAALLSLANESEKWTCVIKHNEEDCDRDFYDNLCSIIIDHDRIIGHNLKFDWVWLRHLLGTRSSILDSKTPYCTAEAEYMIRGQDYKKEYNLDATSKRYGLVRKIDKVKPFWDSGYSTREIPLRILKPYVEQDVFNSLAIYQRQVPLLKRIGLIPQLPVQMEKVRTLAELEENGMLFDKKYAEGVVKDRREQLEMLDFELRDALDWEPNLGSKDDVSLALYGGKRTEKRTIQVPKVDPTKGTKAKVIYEEKSYEGAGFKPLPKTELKKQGFFKTDKATLKQLTTKAKTKKQKLIITNLTNRSVLNKQLTTFLGEKGTTGLLTKLYSGYLHPKYNNTVTTTGRLSSSNPNGQNLSEVIKTAIIPRYDLIGDVDLSQLEWRGAAFMSQCPVMCHEILNDIDQHTVIAEKHFEGVRKPAKIFNFRMIYRGSWYSYYADPGMPAYSMKRWQDIVSGFYEHYYGLRDWHNEIIDTVQKQGWLQIPTGRWYQFHKDDPKTGNYKPTRIANYPVQGLATADIAPLALVMIAKGFRKYQWKSKIIGAVHDSITYDMVSSEVETIRDFSLATLEQLPKYIQQIYGFEFNLPLGGEFKTGTNWGDVE